MAERQAVEERQKMQAGVQQGIGIHVERWAAVGREGWEVLVRRVRGLVGEGGCAAVVREGEGAGW